MAGRWVGRANPRGARRRPMNKPLGLLGAASIALCLAVGSAWPEGQLKAGGAAPTAAVPVPAHPKGHYAALDALPDWGGVWVLNRPAPGSTAPEKPTLKGQYLKDYQSWQRAVEARG